MKLAQLIQESQIQDLNTRALNDPTGKAITESVKPIIFDILTTYILPTAFFLVIAYGLYGTILYFTAYGNDEKATKAKNTITWAIIGAIIIALAFVIVRYISITLLGADEKNINDILQ